MHERDNQSQIQTSEIIVFHVGSIVCGITIHNIQEIKKVREITRVHHAAPFVSGVINLRGQIVTVIDMRVKIGLEQHRLADTLQVIIVPHREELVGLLVDEVDDVLIVQKDMLHPPPANIGSVEGYFFTKVYKTEHELIAIIDKQRILQEEESHSVVQETH